MEVQLKYIGQIELGNEVIISDPCYAADQEYNATVKNVEPGTYHCFLRESEVSLDDSKTTKHFRPSVLFAVHEDYKEDIPYNEARLIDVYDDHPLYDCLQAGSTCVDSGTAGIFDAAYYRENQENDTKLKKETHKWNPSGSWYERVTDCTYGNPPCGLADNKGILSESGWGDGEYNFYVYRDGMTVVAFALDFDVENAGSGEMPLFVDETEGFLTLEEAIESQNRGASVPNGDAYAAQLATWLEELRDLRKILTKAPPEELLDELTDEDGPIALEDIVNEFDDVAVQDPAEHIVYFWMHQLLEAQKRIKKDEMS